MKVRDRLDRLRTRYPGCSVVAFADLSTGMVFAASTREKTAQEQLDALCSQACDLLCGPVAQQLGDEVFKGTDAPLQALCFDTGAIRCFVRDAVAPDEALCFICEPAVALTEMMAEGRDLLITLNRAA